MLAFFIVKNSNHTKIASYLGWIGSLIGVLFEEGATLRQWYYLKSPLLPTTIPLVLA